VIGYDHHFGKDRQGELQHLINYGKKYNFSVEKISAQKVGALAVSSTKIRNAVVAGDIVAANKYLGYLYPLYGKVVKGNGIGHTIGFPTANIEVANPCKLIPADGVYAVFAEYGGIKYPGMMNIGMRPTINGIARILEVNIFNFDKRIYDEMLKITFVDKIRNEIKFPSLELLKEQLVKDREDAERCLISGERQGLF
jgi:riboflavin kinase / FMN adenylyltransferase